MQLFLKKKHYPLASSSKPTLFWDLADLTDFLDTVDIGLSSASSSWLYLPDATEASDSSKRSLSAETLLARESALSSSWRDFPDTSFDFLLALELFLSLPATSARSALEPRDFSLSWEEARDEAESFSITQVPQKKSWI